MGKALRQRLVQLMITEAKGAAIDEGYAGQLSVMVEHADGNRECIGSVSAELAAYAPDLVKPAIERIQLAWAQGGTE